MCIKKVTEELLLQPKQASGNCDATLYLTQTFFFNDTFMLNKIIGIIEINNKELQ